MIAVGILAIALLALISILTFSLRAQSKGSKRHTASLLGASMLNQAGHDLLVNFDQTVVPATPPPFSIPNQPEFKGEIKETLENPDLKKIEVRIFWADQNGAQTETLTCKYLREP